MIERLGLNLDVFTGFQQIPYRAWRFCECDLDLCGNKGSINEKSEIHYRSQPYSLQSDQAELNFENTFT